MPETGGVAVGVGVGVCVGVGVGVEDENDVTAMLSKFIRLPPPLVLRISKRCAADELIAKVAVVRLVELVVWVEPTFVQLEPPLVDFQSSQLLEPSEPYLAWLTEKVPALDALKFILILPVLRTRAAYEPVFLSLVVLPLRASFIYQLPDESVTFPAAYAVFPPDSKPSLKIVVVCI